MSFSRRHFLASASGAAAGSALPFRHALRAGRADQARLGARQLRQPRHLRQADGAWRRTLAAEEINAAGGLLGRKIQVVQYDTQSDIALYTKYAQQLARDDKVDVVHGGITSASREAIRQTFRRANTLYFYNVLYEGGVCDRNCFVTGTTPAQAVEPIVEHRDEAVGQEGLRARRRLQLRPDHREVGRALRQAAQAARSRRPTSSRSTSPTSARPSPRSSRRSPTGSCAALVGGAHLSFYRQWAASGHEQEDPAGLDHLRRRQRAPGAVARRRRRHPDRRQLQPGRRRRRRTRTSWRAGPSASATPRSSTRSPSRSTRASSCGPRRSRRPARSSARRCSRRSSRASRSKGRPGLVNDRRRRPTTPRSTSR